MIKRLKYHEIDLQKYQNCLENSEQRIYSAEKTYLDVVSQNNWELLVYNDYEAVMPVPFINKFGIKLVVNPKLTQQLGIFSLRDSPEVNEKFLDFLVKNFNVWYYAFNQKNLFNSEIKKRKNFILESNDYELIKQKYSPKRKRKLRLNPGVIEYSEIRENIAFTEAQSFIYGNVIGAENPKEIKEFVEILEKFSELNLINFYGFYFKNELINLIAVYQDKCTSVLLGTYNNKNFVKFNGASNLIDYAIKENIQQKIFDFEGGELPNMEEYFRGFRAEMKTYHYVQNSKKDLLKKIFLP